MRGGFFLIVFIFLSMQDFAQVYGKVNKKEANIELSDLYRIPYARKREVVFGNKRYRLYNNYVTFGVGKGYSNAWNTWQMNTALDWNFHLKKTAFQAGGFLAGPRFGVNTSIQVHLAAGYRLERYSYQWAVYGGIAYTDGIHPTATDTSHFYKAGLYLCAQYFYKLKFDYGIGITGFVDANATQTIAGLRIEVFFSSAYRGPKRNDKPEDKEN